MSVKPITVASCLMILLIIVGCTGVYITDARQEARKVVNITVDSKQRQEFFSQLGTFAKANGFSLVIDTLPSSGEDYQIYMKREDVIVSGASLSNEYQIAFADVTDRPPAPDSVFDYLVRELERYVSKVPGTTFLIRE